MTKQVAIILDDQQSRHDAFNEKYQRDYVIFHTYNFVQFFDLITKYPGQIDWVTLDHDLGDHTVDSIPLPADKSMYGTGMLAVRLLEFIPAHYRPTRVNIHSHNYQRGEVMHDRIKKAGWPDATFEHFTDD